MPSVHDSGNYNNGRIIAVIPVLLDRYWHKHKCHMETDKLAMCIRDGFELASLASAAEKIPERRQASGINDGGKNKKRLI